jgi:hypothetical protein
MANADHTVPARPYASTDKRPTNPLGRPYWTLSLAKNAKQAEAARLAGINTGIQAISRILANSEAFRVVQANCSAVEPGHWPLEADITEGLFAALYFLGEHAMHLTQPSLDDPAFE